jgi:hypothetical protein
MKIARIITFGMLVVSAIVCIPLALLYSALIAHALNAVSPLDGFYYFFYPWLLIGGTWIAVWLLGKYKHWIAACILLAILVGIYLYWWSTLELP